MSHLAPDELLLDYAAGALPEGPALAVALHVALEPEARRTVRQLRGLGTVLLESEAGEAAMDEAALGQALARLDAVPVEARPARVPTSAFDWAPPPLRPYLAGKTWQRAFGGFEEMRLDLHGDRHIVALLKLEPGKGLPVHRHTASEYTVVLQGGYTDNTGNYVAGDFAVGPGPEAHEPIADPGEPCIALIVLERPIVLTGFWARLLNPLLRRGWM